MYFVVKEKWDFGAGGQKYDEKRFESITERLGFLCIKMGLELIRTLGIQEEGLNE